MDGAASGRDIKNPIVGTGGIMYGLEVLGDVSKMNVVPVLV